LVKNAITTGDPIWASDGGITGDDTQTARGLRNNSSILNRIFTVETCLRKSQNNFNCWWWTNRNPWNTGTGAFGLQFSTYSTKLVGISGWNHNNSETAFELNETNAEISPSFETVAIIYDGTTLKMHRSGMFFDSLDVEIPLDMILNIPFIVNGSVNNSAALSLRFSDSRLYAVRVYHRVLSSSELLKNFNLDSQRFNS